jgi:hypothetical protein
MHICMYKHNMYIYIYIRVERSSEKKKRYINDNDMLLKDNELLIIEKNILKEWNTR